MDNTDNTDNMDNEDIDDMEVIEILRDMEQMDSLENIERNDNMARISSVKHTSDEDRSTILERPTSNSDRTYVSKIAKRTHKDVGKYYDESFLFQPIYDNESKLQLSTTPASTITHLASIRCELKKKHFKT
jgi:hypothetical protein